VVDGMAWVLVLTGALAGSVVLNLGATSLLAAGSRRVRPASRWEEPARALRESSLRDRLGIAVFLAIVVDLPWVVGILCTAPR
jgi:hypothetical protein